MKDRAISLNAVIKAIRHAEVNFSVRSEIDFTRHKREVQEIIDNVLDAQEKALSELPSVTPEKTGHWIPIYQGDEIINYRCSACELGDTNGSTNIYGWDYCRRCGAKMIEPQERSDEE